MKKLFLDIETYSKVSVKDGLHVHAEQAELLMLAYAVDRGPVKQWVPAEGETMPRELETLLYHDPNVHVHAFNAAYEHTVMSYVKEITLPLPPLYRWRCDMVLALTKSLPGALEKLGPILGMPEDKKKLATGKRLIRLFCQDRKPTANKPWPRADHTNEPEKWDELKEYNRQDVEAQRQVYYRLCKWPVSNDEQRLWELDQVVNKRGLPIDRDMVDGAIEIAEREQALMMERMKLLTGLPNPNSLAQLGGWLEDRNVLMMNMKKVTVENTLKRDDLPDDVKEVLELRVQTSKTSTKKYYSLRKAVSEDGTLKHAFQFYGANRTGRWAGRIFQPHNLPRGYKDETDLNTSGDLIRERDPQNLLALMLGPTMDVLSQSLRSVVRAPDGKTLGVADLNAIENRVLGWVANCHKILAVHRRGHCPYKDFGVEFFGVPYDEITPEQRTLSKPPVLGCGYMLSGGEQLLDQDGLPFKTGLWAYAEGMGVEFSRQQSHRGVSLFRDTYPEIVDYWYDLDKAFRQTIVDRQPHSVGPVTFRFDNPFVCIDLPIGRSLYYYRACIKQKIPPWERDKERPKTKATICYWGVDQETRQWKEVTTHPGKITENIVQAIARDILAEGLRKAEARGLDVRGHVHDEIIQLSDVDKAQDELDTLIEVMSEDIAWAPGLPLGAEGFLSKVYRKD